MSVCAVCLDWKKQTCPERPLIAQMRSVAMSAIWSLSGKNGRRCHRVFVDAEVIRDGPLLEVAGRGEKLGEPFQDPHGCCEQPLRHGTQSAAGVAAPEI